MGSFKGWELEAFTPDRRLDLRNLPSSLVETLTTLSLNRMESGQVLELAIAESSAVEELAHSLQVCGHRLLKIESLSSQGLLVWLQHSPDHGNPWDFDDDLPG